MATKDESEAVGQRKPLASITTRCFVCVLILRTKMRSSESRLEEFQKKICGCYTVLLSGERGYNVI